MSVYSSSLLRVHLFESDLVCFELVRTKWYCSYTLNYEKSTVKTFTIISKIKTIKHIVYTAAIRNKEKEINS